MGWESATARPAGSIHAPPPPRGTYTPKLQGKSTLSDCLLELTGNISAKEKKDKAQFTDTLKVIRGSGSGRLLMSAYG